MKESTTYQEIWREGHIDGAVTEARKLLLQFGTKTLGRPSARTQAALAKITDLDRLESLIGRLGAVEKWQQLLADLPIDRK